MALVACDASTKDQFMGRYWTISNRDNTKLIKKHICSSEQSKSTLKAREERTMLDMIQQIHQQMKHLNNGRVIVYNNNMQLINKFNFGMVKSIEYA